MATSAQDAIGYERTQAFQLVMAVVKALLVILFSVHVALALGWPWDGLGMPRILGFQRVFWVRIFMNFPEINFWLGSL